MSHGFSFSVFLLEFQTTTALFKTSNQRNSILFYIAQCTVCVKCATDEHVSSISCSLFVLDNWRKILINHLWCNCIFTYIVLAHSCSHALSHYFVIKSHIPKSTCTQARQIYWIIKFVQTCKVRYIKCLKWLELTNLQFVFYRVGLWTILA